MGSARVHSTWPHLFDLAVRRLAHHRQRRVLLDSRAYKDRHVRLRRRGYNDGLPLLYTGRHWYQPDIEADAPIPKPFNRSVDSDSLRPRGVLAHNGSWVSQMAALGRD